jgi:hypothetical protein
LSGGRLSESVGNSDRSLSQFAHTVPTQLVGSVWEEAMAASTPFKRLSGTPISEVPVSTIATQLYELEQKSCESERLDGDGDDDDDGKPPPFISPTTMLVREKAQ